MSVTIQVADVEATIQDGKWSCEHGPLRKVLTALLDPEGPRGSDPYPDYNEAQRAASALKGTITRYTKLPDGPEDLVL